MKSKEHFTQKVNDYLSKFKGNSFILDQVCKKENQDDFLEVVRDNDEWIVNGNNIYRKHPVKPIEEITRFFDNFNPGKSIDCIYGSYTAKNFRTFVNNLIKKAQCQKHPKYQKGALFSLRKLMDTLSTEKGI